MNQNFLTYATLAFLRLLLLRFCLVVVLLFFSVFLEVTKRDSEASMDGACKNEAIHSMLKCALHGNITPIAKLTHHHNAISSL